jgi:hypothetical protein
MQAPIPPDVIDAVFPEFAAFKEWLRSQLSASAEAFADAISLELQLPAAFTEAIERELSTRSLLHLVPDTVGELFNQCSTDQKENNEK